MLKRKFNLVLAVLAIVMVIGLTSYNKDEVKAEEETNEILSYFDLDDEKEYWNGSIEDPFEDDKVVVIFKKTWTYPKLTLNNFDVVNLKSIEYTQTRPRNNPKTFRQIATIYLNEVGKEKVMEAIKELEKLEFIQYAGPRVIYKVYHC